MHTPTHPRRSLLLALLPLLLLSLCAPLSVRGGSGASGDLGATGRPIIQMAVLQYFNPMQRALNYTPGYELDAFEPLIGLELAVRDLNSGRYASRGESSLSAYELQLDVHNSYYSQAQGVAVVSRLLDAQSNPHPPAVLLGLLGYDEALSAALASQPYQTPLLSNSVTAPSLSAAFPNFNRYCPTDQLEAFALLALFHAFQWRRVGLLYNTEGGFAAPLVDILRQFGQSLLPGLDLVIEKYSQTMTEAEGLVERAPDVRGQLQALKDAGVRVILLAAFSSDVPGVLTVAAELGMVGSPYAWLGANQICFDDNLWSNPRAAHLLDGFLCTQSSVSVAEGADASPLSDDFRRSWAEAYERDPADVYYIREPRLSGNAYDSVFGAARAMQTVLDLRAQCNLSDTGGLGTDRPLSGLLPPSMLEFNPYLYSQGASVAGGYNLSFTRSLVPTTFPGVCPWLLHQVGQGRVLNKILRTQRPFAGATGSVILMESGDRVADVMVYNIHGGVKRRVATVSGVRVFAQLLDGPLGQAMAEFAALNASDLIAERQAGSAAPRPPIVGDESWRASYNPLFFRPYMAYEPVSQQLSLQPGRQLDARVFSELQVDAIRFADGTSSIPLDAPVRVELVRTVSRGAWLSVLSLTALVGVYNLALLAFQLRYRDHKIVKITAPKMNVVFLCGSMGVLVFVVLLGLDSTQIGGDHAYVRLCHAKFALLAVSFSLAFGSLFAKTYRLDAIFNSKHLHVHVVRDRDILLMVLRLLLVDALLLAVWGAHSPFYRSLEQDEPFINPLQLSQLQVPTQESCGSDNFTIYVATFLVYKGALLAFGLYLALRVRKIRIAALNDSKWIVMSIYNVTLISVLLIPVSIVVGGSADTFYLLVSLALLYLVASVLSLLFLPRVLAVCFDVDVFATRAAEGLTAYSMATGVGSVAHDSIDTASSSDAAALRAELAKVKLRLTHAQATLNAARKQMNAAGITLVMESQIVRTGSAGGGSGGAAGPTVNPSSQLDVAAPVEAENRGAAFMRSPTHSLSPYASQVTHATITSPSWAGAAMMPQQRAHVHVHGHAPAAGGGGGAGHGSEVEMRRMTGGTMAMPPADRRAHSAERASGSGSASLADLPGAANPNEEEAHRGAVPPSLPHSVAPLARSDIHEAGMADLLAPPPRSS